ncbi:MAG: vWA domain-containing protein [Vulcanimicrobiaceae bacterium]
MVDPAALAAGFDAALAGRGVCSGTRRAEAFARAFAALPPPGYGELYWLARVSMLPSIADLAGFNAAFIDYWNRLMDADTLRSLVDADPEPSAREPARPRPQRRNLPPPPSEQLAGELDANDAALFVAMASIDERLSTIDLAELDERERALAVGAIARLRIVRELRFSRRRRLRPHGDRLDLRASLRHAARTTGEVVKLRTTLRRRTPRPLVFLCDVSGSMGPYARALLLYARTAARARPRVRAFAFATRLTDLTRAVRHESLRTALRAFARELPDYGGGTRIGAALHEFNVTYGQRGAARGGTVVILSDGWERDDPALIGREMARLRRLTRKIIWVNPQKKHSAFEPLALGMAAALPFVDALVAGHNLRSLDAIADAIEAVAV